MVRICPHALDLPPGKAAGLNTATFLAVFVRALLKTLTDRAGSHQLPFWADVDMGVDDLWKGYQQLRAM